MNKKKTITFVVFAYGISWLIWMPNVLAHNFNVNWGFSKWLHIVGGLGPFLGAVITIYLFDRNAGVVEYFKEKLFRIQSIKWTLIGLGMPIVFFLIAVLILGIFSGDWVVISDLGLNSKLPITNPILIWLLWCFFYGLGEEGGWRGLLFPEFTRSFKARIATLYVAFIWIPWHIPVFFYDKDLGTMGLFGTVGWAVGLVFGSLLLGWLVKQSQLNLWPVILWHGTFNFFTTSDRLNPLIPGLMSFMVIISALWIARRYGENLELEPAKNKQKLIPN
jgi:membrane protease YdiL (CAAX protease family)